MEKKRQLINPKGGGNHESNKISIKHAKHKTLSEKKTLNDVQETEGTTDSHRSQRLLKKYLLWKLGKEPLSLHLQCQEHRSRLRIRALGAVPSTAHDMMKFPTRVGVVTITSDRAKPLEIQMKDDESWRICMDFTNLNKACPEDCYPLPHIDWKVESLCGYPIKCFLDAYKGYYHIQMAKEDEEKTAFHTSQGIPVQSSKKVITILKTLKRCIKKSDFVWTEEAEKALKDIKKQMAELLTLTAPIERETLIIFGSCGKKAKEILLGSPGGGNHESTSKANLVKDRKLMEIGEVKEVATIENQETTKVWKLFTDGSSNEGVSRAGLIQTSPDGVEFTYALCSEFIALNNEAEYEALLAGLRIEEVI
ncbi:reverse transcriptase domain-containing protein [Tanacetum coccineum]|uniref:Reverse transcriptase domain-containing protein n=1 Tax=Tanacetum coccineum TaxID=301880 RepID=A0ABQ5F7V3_9ASTR